MLKRRLVGVGVPTLVWLEKKEFRSVSVAMGDVGKKPTSQRH